MKTVLGLMVIGLMAGSTQAGTVLMRTDGDYTTTGDLIEGAYNAPLTTNVQEIADLVITAYSGATNHQLNADSGSLGINNKSTTSDQAARFEAGEKLILSFNKDVEITQFDFRYFDAGESFVIASSNQADFIIEYDALSDKGSDFIHTNLTIMAETEITLFAITSGNIGLEGLEMSVLGGSGNLVLSLAMSNSMSVVTADFDGTAAGTYVMQTSTNLASNVWNTVSAPFSSDTNWVIEATNRAEFYRVVPQ